MKKKVAGYTAGYAAHMNPATTPQSEPLPGKNMVENHAGGYAFQITDEQRVMRFLILGAEGSTYYQSERELTLENAKAITDMLARNPKWLIDTLVDVSTNNRAYKQDPAIFALALAYLSGSYETRKMVEAAFPEVIRTGTHLLGFVSAFEEMGGKWGRRLRRIVANWYLSKSADSLAYQAVKYQQRGGWSLRDLLRLSHADPRTADGMRARVLRWIATRETPEGELPGVLSGFLEVGKTAIKDAPALIKQAKLPREAVPSEWLNDPDVWAALLEDMPLGALFRNLGNLSKCGLLAEGKWDVVKNIGQRLTDTAMLKKARIHPLAVLAAYVTYANGGGFFGRGQWSPVPQIVSALDDAYYQSFAMVVPTGRRFVVGVDVSPSMSSGEVSGIRGLSPAMGAAAMAMLWLRTEQNTVVRGFADSFVDMRLTPQMPLRDVIQNAHDYSHKFGSTDCAQPMRYALRNRIEADVFVVITDNETWYGDMHPSTALRQYRKQMGIPAKLAVIAMTATDISIADPGDAGMMDFVGFDTSTPSAIEAFIKE